MVRAVQQVLESGLVAAAQALESHIDSEIQSLDKLDVDDIETLRRQRLLQLKQQAQNKQAWMKRGHGEYREISNEKEFFSEIKGEERLVCHFFRENWPCKVMDKHLQLLALKHLESKFIKVNAEKAPFLTDKLKIWMLPTLALVRKEKVTSYIVGFDELGGRDDFQTQVLEDRLAAAGMLHEEGMHIQMPRQERRAVRRTDNVKTIESDEDSDF